MQIDDKIYPKNLELSTDDFDYTKNFGEFTLNEKIDNNIVYSSSSSAYADLDNKVIFSWYYTNRKTTQGMDEQTKKEYIDNFLDCGANVYSIRNTKPNSTIDEQISALGVRSQIDEMIANGDTVNIPVEQGLNDTQCGGLAGIGTLASFSVLTAVYCVRKHKLEKMIK